MKYVRYEKDGKTHFGVLENGKIAELSEDYVLGAERTGVVTEEQDVKLLAPYIPGKIVGVGANYKSFLDAKKREAGKQ